MFDQMEPERLRSPGPETAGSVASAKCAHRVSQDLSNPVPRLPILGMGLGTALFAER
jgi:hypothetical protein